MSDKPCDSCIDFDWCWNKNNLGLKLLCLGPFLSKDDFMEKCYGVKSIKEE